MTKAKDFKGAQQEKKAPDKCGESHDLSAQKNASVSQTEPVEAENVEKEQQPAATADSTCKDEKDEKFLRLLADFDNFRKRVLRERAEMHREVIERLMRELLPVLDSMDAAMASLTAGESSEKFLEGFKKISGQFNSALNKFDIQRFDAEPGDIFDPKIHEAIAVSHSDEVGEHCVIRQLRPGYFLGGRLLRASQVLVSSGPSVGKGNAVPDGFVSEETRG